ncbi:trans-sulfuration enzyme family protein [Methanomethylophilus alvi]|uniref:trans-sulfuration enzyme family protein n=1 Tax=Methanomethylophilus alvi TaxID=1291540 RepID=UPI0037DC993C
MTREYGRELGIRTRAVHVGNDVDKDSGAIKRPLTMANSYELPYDPSVLNWSDAGANLYTRNGGTNQRFLQERIASLEGGEDCVVPASRVAALSGLFFATLNKGDHVVFSDVTYIAVYRLLNELFNRKYGVETTMVDSSDPEKVEAAMRPNTKLVHIETPGNPTLKISDIRRIADIAHRHGAKLSVDNTFASPYNQRPIELGADYCVESLTKYINGHGDAMGGAIIGRKEDLDIIRAQSQVNLGGVISPFNAWMIMRGSVTLPLRMRAHNENAMEIARHLKSLPCVSFVSYPGLEDDPGYEVAKTQMSGFGGMISFGLKAGHDKCNEFVSHLKIITSAVSLGHDESLIVFLGEDDERMHLYDKRFHNGFFRFSVGIEDAEDIISDIDQALRSAGLL